MKFSKSYIKTLKETPKEAEVISHKLLLRAGMIKRLASGVYSYLPLGLKTLKKIEEIVREEMNRSGSHEVFLPVLQPAELWQESGRWTAMGPEMFRLKDRNERDFALGPTHEEVMADIVRSDISSYKSLPLNLYQIQTKFRDERRPRFGLMRGREFLMKDAYSFHRDRESLDEEFQNMHDTYSRIFARCKLKFRVVEADSGAIGGTGSKEFHVLAESGEDEILFCNTCDYASNVEAATAKILQLSAEDPLMPDLVPTPSISSIEDLTNFLKIPMEKTVKSMLYKDMVTDDLYMVLIRGDFEINELKLKNTIDTLGVTLLSDSEIEAAGLIKGFIGPYGVTFPNLKIIADQSVPTVINSYTGANQNHFHYRNVNHGRDYKADKIADLRLVKAGDLCPRCGTVLQSARGIETGHIFKLGDKYSKPMKVTYLDETGTSRVVIMGSYGIGISRTMAAAIEQNNDENGMIWPSVIAPYVVDVIPANVTESNQLTLAKEITEMLEKENIDAILDDREERPGFKFKDADLIGFPFKIIAGKKAHEGIVELKIRKTGETFELEKESIVEKIKELMKIY